MARTFFYHLLHRDKERLGETNGAGKWEHIQGPYRDNKYYYSKGKTHEETPTKKDPAHTHGFPLNHIDLVHAEVMLLLLLVVAVHRTNMCPRGWENKIAIKIPLPRIMCASVCERKTNAPRV